MTLLTYAAQRLKGAQKKAKRKDKARRIGKPKESPSRQIKRADAMFSLKVRSIGRCQADDGRPCKGVLQCAHLFSRRYRAVRWTDDNAVSLCAGHHLYYTHRPIEWDNWMQNRLTLNRYEELRHLALTGGKPDMAEVLSRLEHKGEQP